MAAVRILLVEDSAEDAMVLEACLDRVPSGSYALEHVESLREAEERLGRDRFDVVLLDLMLPDSRGLEGVKRLGEVAPNVPVVVLTGRTDPDLPRSAMRDGAQDYLVKGDLQPSLLDRTLAYAIERKRAAEALRRSEEQFRAFFEQAPTGLAVISEDLLVRRVNAKIEEMSGFRREDLVGGHFRELLHAEEAEEAEETFRRLVTGRAARLQAELRFRRRDGGLEWAIAGAVKVPSDDGSLILVTLEYVTERRRLESQLLQAQKMEALGRLAGGVAHDFNNLLTAIVGYAELLREAGPGSPTWGEEVEEIRNSARRAAALTQQLLTFSRKGMTRFLQVDLARLVIGLRDMLARLVGDRCRVVLDVQEVGVVRADPAQIEQLLINLVLNARDAMPEGGTVRVELQRSPDGGSAMLSVTDTGVGMDGELLKRVFEPFFTTKADDQAAGLGLSTVYGIVRQAGGQIEVESQPARGSTFRITVPLVTSSAPPVQRAQASHADEREKTILLVEDDLTIRRLVPRLLKGRGYRVLLAADGQEAMDLVGEHGPAIDLVLSDVVLPRLSGPEVVQRIRQVLPEVKVLYTSGYSPDPSLRSDVLQERVHFLPKPFTSVELEESILRALGS